MISTQENNKKVQKSKIPIIKNKFKFNYIKLNTH